MLVTEQTGNTWSQGGETPHLWRTKNVLDVTNSGKVECLLLLHVVG